MWGRALPKITKQLLSVIFLSKFITQLLFCMNHNNLPTKRIFIKESARWSGIHYYDVAFFNRKWLQQKQLSHSPTSTLIKINRFKNSAWLPWITHKVWRLISNPIGSMTCKYNNKWLNIIFRTKHKMLPKKIRT
jgi:hypothetical protein